MTWHEDNWTAFTHERSELSEWAEKLAPLIARPRHYYLSDHDLNPSNTDPEVVRQVIGPRIWDAIFGKGGA